VRNAARRCAVAAVRTCLVAGRLSLWPVLTVTMIHCCGCCGCCAVASLRAAAKLSALSLPLSITSGPPGLSGPALFSRPSVWERNVAVA
jgi:hypothetical protein